MKKETKDKPIEDKVEVKVNIEESSPIKKFSVPRTVKELRTRHKNVLGDDNDVIYVEYVKENNKWIEKLPKAKKKKVSE